MKQCWNPLHWKQMFEFDSSVHKRICLKRTVCTRTANAASASGHSDRRIVQCSKNGAGHWALWCDSCQPVSTDHQSDRILQITRGSGHVRGLVQIQSFLFQSSKEKNCVSLVTSSQDINLKNQWWVRAYKSWLQQHLHFIELVHVQRYFNIYATKK